MNTVAGSTSISSEAFELLDCVASELNDTVYGLAEGLAKQRTPTAPTVQIEAKDVEQAARFVIRSMREAMEAGRVPRSLSHVLDQMERCFEAKCDQ